MKVPGFRRPIRAANGTASMLPCRVGTSGAQAVDSAVAPRSLERPVCRRSHGHAGVVVFVLTAAIVMVAINLVVASRHLPTYATWTGIWALEAKLHQFEAFAGGARSTPSCWGSPSPTRFQRSAVLSDDVRGTWTYLSGVQSFDRRGRS